MAMLSEWESKPKNGYFYLLSEQGDKSKLQAPKENWVAGNVTFGKATVYNAETDRVSDKSIYVHKSGRFYIKGGAGYGNRKMFWLDEFE